MVLCAPDCYVSYTTQQQDISRTFPRLPMVPMFTHPVFEEMLYGLLRKFFCALFHQFHHLKNASFCKVQDTNTNYMQIYDFLSSVLGFLVYEFLLFKETFVKVFKRFFCIHEYLGPPCSICFLVDEQLQYFQVSKARCNVYRRFSILKKKQDTLLRRFYLTLHCVALYFIILLYKTEHC